MTASVHNLAAYRARKTSGAHRHARSAPPLHSASMVGAAAVRSPVLAGQCAPLTEAHTCAGGCRRVLGIGQRAWRWWDREGVERVHCRACFASGRTMP